jgi:hypothetical protein
MTRVTKAVVGIAVAAAFAGSQAVAAGRDGPLAPGKPAGVHEAVRHGPNLLLIGGVAAAVAAGVVIAVTTSGSSSCSATNCPTSTSTSGTTS